MAIYHLSVQIIKRSEGRSAVAAAAYRSGTSLTSEWDGITYDYTRKGWVEHTEILLPEYAPESFKKRQHLWNQVEMAEKSANAQLAREIEIALPLELSREAQIALAREFIQENCVEKGMCADLAIHNPPVRNGYGQPIDRNGKPTNDPEKMTFRNPHAHILVTMRPLNERGRWEAKYEKSYLCRKDNREYSFRASRIKEAEENGWRKQYRYYFGNRTIWLTAEAAEKKNLKRVDKQPRIKNIPNRTIAKWNSTETLESWRESWEELCNRYLKENGVDAQIDHRSYADQGIDRVPGVHFGPSAYYMEKKGRQTELGKLNEEIMDNNRFLEETQKVLDQMVAKEKEQLKKTALHLESLRDRYIISAYQEALYSASLAAEGSSIQEQIASANANARAIEQAMKAITNLMDTIELKNKELSTCSLFLKKKRESIKKEIIQAEKELSEVKKSLTELQEKKTALQEKKSMDQEVMKEKRKRVQYLKKMQTQQYKEFYRLVGECREQKGKLREILWTGRASRDQFVEKRLRDYYKEDFRNEILEEVRKNAPDVPKETPTGMDKIRTRKR